jgi:hypothetical protein
MDPVHRRLLTGALVGTATKSNPRGRSAMSAAVKYLTKKVAKANAEYEVAREEHAETSKRAEECSERAWDVRRELDNAINADIEKAKAEL